ncbi:hypothetical protein [Rufibacter latericius]|uniref:Uncharacterized protein n=1 Tax=Rufibacter latericius TaxID=2487040 RepID=A0A3M9M8Z8_9BACT|nr:hypothetical protein [Rufibacter latericius]RNI22022.1 hypothetical protein EFB08_23095 [Rufibacter latericius]
MNTLSKHITRLKRFLDHCVEEDHPVCAKYRTFYSPTQTGEVESLTLEELQALQNIDFTSDEVLHFVQNLSSGTASGTGSNGPRCWSACGMSS